MARQYPFLCIILAILLVSCGKGRSPDVPGDETIPAVPGTYFITKSEATIDGVSSSLGPKEATITIREEGGFLSLELAWSFAYLKAYSDENEDKDILLKIRGIPYQVSDGSYCFSPSECSDVEFFQAHEEAPLSEVSVTGTFGEDMDLTVTGIYRDFQTVVFHIGACSYAKSDLTPEPYNVIVDWMFPSAILYLHNETQEPISIHLIWKEGIPSSPEQRIQSVLPGEERIVMASSLYTLNEYFEALELIFANGEKKRYPLVSTSDFWFEGLGEPETMPDFVLHKYPHCIDRHVIPAYHYQITSE